MKAKDVVELEIESFGMEGEGVAHAGGYTFFVPFALPKEKIKAAVDRVKGTVVFAHIIKMLEASPERVAPVCPLFGKCGGCALQHVSYEKQLEIKKQNVLHLFKKNAGVELSDLPIEKSEPLFYRNKISLPFGEEAGKPVLGFYKRGTHKVLAVERCPLHGAWVEPLIAAVVGFARKNGLSVYDEKTGKGLLRHLVARRLPSAEGFSFSVTVVLNGEKLPKEREFADAVCAATDGKTSVFVCKNTARNNVILSPFIRKIAGPAEIETRLCGGEWEVSPLSFLQVNFPVAEKIYSEAARAIPEGSFVVDAYSGTGIMSALLAKKAAEVVGIEVIKDATLNAARNAARFGVDETVKHLCGEVEDRLPEVVEGKEDYALVVDPPRAGLDESVVKTILSNPPKSIVYVSCSPATLTRDVARLLRGGYELSSVKLFDMFPQTPHVETVVQLSYKNYRS